MSFRAYLDNIEEKTGKPPREFISEVKEKGYDTPETKAGTIVEWFEAGLRTQSRSCDGARARHQEGSAD